MKTPTIRSMEELLSSSLKTQLTFLVEISALNDFNPHFYKFGTWQDLWLSQYYLGSLPDSAADLNLWKVRKTSNQSQTYNTCLAFKWSMVEKPKGKKWYFSYPLIFPIQTFDKWLFPHAFILQNQWLSKEVQIFIQNSQNQKLYDH